MLKSQFSVLMANLFLIGALLSWNLLSCFLLTFLAFCWFISAIFTMSLEKKQFLRFKADIEEYNRQMAERFKNGRKRK